MFAGCYLPAYSHCATGVNMLTDIHTLQKPLHQSSPTQCCWPAVCPDQSDCWVQERGTVVWPWPDKEATPCHPFLSVCHSHTYRHLSIHPPVRTTGCPVQTPAPTTSVVALSPQHWLVCMCLCVFVPAPITSLLIPSPQHWPRPSTLHLCTCVPVFC